MEPMVDDVFNKLAGSEVVGGEDSAGNGEEDIELLYVGVSKDVRIPKEGDDRDCPR